MGRLRQLFNPLRRKRSKSATATQGSSELGRAPSSGIIGKTVTQSGPGHLSGSNSEAAIGLELLASGGVSPKVDIVFVHGLRGHRLKTWSRDDVCWPRDVLPADLPDARVFSFGWDAMIANAASYASQESLFGHAGTLLEDLERFREDSKILIHTYPLIFIAHSLGGLLVKQMLIKVSSYQLNGRFGSLGNPILHTKGVIFMGTPHRGSDATKYAELLAGVAKAALRQPNNQLLQVLQKYSAELEQQRDQFVTISKELDVVCFRETLPTGIGLILPEASAVYDGFNVRSVGIQADHMGMTKFSGCDDNGYKRVLQQVNRQIRETLVASDAQRIETLRLKILNALEFDIMNDREETIAAAFNQTCDWLLPQDDDFDDIDGSDGGNEIDDVDESDNDNDDGGDEDEEPVDRLKSWLSSDKESIFWISGKAGSGKSTLMKFLHKNIRRLDHSFIDDHTIVASFFFYNSKSKNKRFELQMSREGMIRSIIHQCLKQEKSWIQEVFPDICGEVISEQDFDVELRTKVSNWTWLSQAFSNLLCTAERSKRKMLFLVDGLDEYRILQRTAEYAEETLDSLLYGNDNNDEQWGYSKWIYDGHFELIKLLETFQGNAFVKACVSSRELSTFESRFRDKPRIRIQEHTACGIVYYCKTRLERDALGLKDVDTLSTAVKIKAQGVFLWVQLVVGLIVQHNDEGDDDDTLLELINSLPEQLGGKGGLYWHMILHIPRDKVQHASRMLYIMAEVGDDVELSELHCAAETISTQKSPPITPSPSELQTFWESVTLFLATPDTLEKEAVLELQRLQRRLQSVCLGLLETWQDVNIVAEWASINSQKHVESHGISQIKSYRVSFMHSTVQDFLSQDYTRRRLRKEAFNTNLALLDGTCFAFRKNNRLLARWLLSTYHQDIPNYFKFGIRETNDEERFHSAFENINKIVGAIRQAITDYFSGHDFSLAAPEGFWAYEFELHYEREGREAPVGDIDNLTMAVSLGYDTYLESRLIKLEEQSRSERATDLLIECFTARNIGTERVIDVSPDVVKVLLQHGADPDARIAVAAENCPGQFETYPVWTALPVWVYTLGCIWRDHEDENYLFRASSSMPWICYTDISAIGLMGADLEITDKEIWERKVQMIWSMFKSGAQTDFELQFGRKKTKEVKRGADESLDPGSDPKSESNRWYYGDAGTSTALEMISTLVPDFLPTDR